MNASRGGDRSHQRQRPRGGRHAIGGVDVVLDQHRHAVQRPAEALSRRARRRARQRSRARRGSARSPPAATGPPGRAPRSAPDTVRQSLERSASRLLIGDQRGDRHFFELERRCLSGWRGLPGDIGQAGERGGNDCQRDHCTQLHSPSLAQDATIRPAPSQRARHVLAEHLVAMARARPEHRNRRRLPRPGCPGAVDPDHHPLLIDRQRKRQPLAPSDMLPVGHLEPDAAAFVLLELEVTPRAVIGACSWRSASSTSRSAERLVGREVENGLGELGVEPGIEQARGSAPRARSVFVRIQAASSSSKMSSQNVTPALRRGGSSRLRHQIDDAAILLGIDHVFVGPLSVLRPVDVRLLASDGEQRARWRYDIG